MNRLSTQNLSVGYNKKVLIGGIDISIAPGEVVSLIGPNGAGKSTVLKSITRQLEKLGGEIYVDGENAAALSYKNFATRFSVVLTERLKTERMTCEEVVEAGRYPYTGFFGRLTEEDRRIVRESLSMVGGEDLAAYVAIDGAKNYYDFTDAAVEELKEMMREGVRQEIKWGKYIIGNDIPGLNEQMVEDYIKYLGNLRSNGIGFGNLYDGYEKEPESMAWVSQYSNANLIKTDFFEARSTAYAKSSALEDDL